MLRWIFLIGWLFLPFALPAQWRVVDKSHKQKPAWVGGAARNYLIVSAQGPTLETAKEELLIGLKQQIVGTIATHILSETQLHRQQTTVGKEVIYAEQVTSHVKTRLAHVPFVSEVSLSKAKAYYWEKQYDKKRKIYQYEYHIQYLFTDFEIQALVAQFNDHENELDNRLASFMGELEQIESVEQIDRTLQALKAFAEEFDREDPRRARTEELSNAYRKLYGFIDLREEKHSGFAPVCLALYLNDRRISSQQKPQLLSNCAGSLSYQIQDGCYQIHYDDAACYPEDENYLEIRFRFGNKMTAKKIYLK